MTLLIYSVLSSFSLALITFQKEEKKRERGVRAFSNIHKTIKIKNSKKQYHTWYMNSNNANNYS
jgi:hypothetical protein